MLMTIAEAKKANFRYLECQQPMQNIGHFTVYNSYVLDLPYIADLI